MSATEWTPSASIDDAPVNAKPTNLATAIARLANSAAITALVPWAWMSCVALAPTVPAGA